MRTLFNAPFDEQDLVVAQRDHALPQKGRASQTQRSTPIPLCSRRASPMRSGPRSLSAAPRSSRLLAYRRRGSLRPGEWSRGAWSKELYQVFRDDSRGSAATARLQKRRATLRTAAEIVFGQTDAQAKVERLCRSGCRASLAHVCPVAMLAWCLVATTCSSVVSTELSLPSIVAMVASSRSLFLDPLRQTPDGATPALELRICRKCGQPILFGYRFPHPQGEVLRAFGMPRQERGKPVWLTWESPQAHSEDEERTRPMSLARSLGPFPRSATTPPPERSAEWAAQPLVRMRSSLWLLRARQLDQLSRCFACGSPQHPSLPSVRTPTPPNPLLADGFYRCPSSGHRARPLSLRLSTTLARGVSSLAFTPDSRQSAAYFALLSGKQQR